jgi:hypothetical protein
VDEVRNSADPVLRGFVEGKAEAREGEGRRLSFGDQMALDATALEA